MLLIPFSGSISNVLSSDLKCSLLQAPAAFLNSSYEPITILTSIF